MKEKTAFVFKTSFTLIIVAVCFSFNSSSLNTDTKQSLDQIVSKLESLPDYTITLSGHTDNVGSDTYNYKLSESRAIAVRNYLVSKNVDSTKITIEFHGEQDPMIANDSEENRAMNRRVEVLVNAEKAAEKDVETDTQGTVVPELPKPIAAKTPHQQEVNNEPAKTEIKKKKVRRRLVWTGWRTGFHWSTSGR